MSMFKGRSFLTLLDYTPKEKGGHSAPPLRGEAHRPRV